jgi:putative ABC transport system permease protein
LPLGLTALGVFAIAAFLTAARTRELGIRLAIGATPQSLIHLTLRRALVPIAAGVAIGVLVTLWIGRFAEAQLFRVETRDPLTLTATAVTVLAAGLVAAWLPARRANRVDPILALKAE